MNSKNIQAFLMVSAAFFAINAPLRTGTASALANAMASAAHTAPARGNTRNDEASASRTQESRDERDA